MEVKLRSLFYVKVFFGGGGIIQSCLKHEETLWNEYSYSSDITDSKTPFFKFSKLKLETFWFFPYFMEQHIKNSLPDFKMFDYKVNYDNHSSFTDTGTKKRKFGSPVRIFTNIPLPLLDLEGVSGYKFCNPCGVWVSNENKHCKECNACTSKNGRTYIHCEKCSKCVKPSYKHCETCSRCCLSNHVCGEFQPNPNCYNCHEPGHKKRQCPLLGENKKRPLAVSKIPKKKKKVTY